MLNVQVCWRRSEMYKQYIDAGTLLQDAFELALEILASNFKPDLIVGIWRGGTPVGIAIQEVLEFAGIHSDHCSIRTSSYTGINVRRDVRVQGLEYLASLQNPARSILLVDDVFDTGLSIQQVIVELEKIYGTELPVIKIATPYFKPENNLSARRPDFYLHETSSWLVFPHELSGLSNEEILANKNIANTCLQRLLLVRK